MAPLRVTLERGRHFVQHYKRNRRGAPRWRPSLDGTSPMDAFKESLSPLTESLPPGIRDFLDAGGWWLVFVVVGLLALLLLDALLRRLWRAIFRRRTSPIVEADREFYEDLA